MNELLSQSQYQTVPTDDEYELTTDPHSPYPAVQRDDFDLPPSSTHKPSFFEAASLSAVQLVHTSTQSSTSKAYKAEDHFLGTKKVKGSAEAYTRIRVITPKSLSLFDLVVLADAVHVHDPLYSILKHQCYWFACTTLNVVESVYKGNGAAHDEGHISADDISIPSNDYRPHLAGTWKGILITRVEDVVSTAMVFNFRVYLEEKKKEVLFIFNLICHFLKSRRR